MIELTPDTDLLPFETFALLIANLFEFFGYCCLKNFKNSEARSKLDVEGKYVLCYKIDVLLYQLPTQVDKKAHRIN